MNNVATEMKECPHCKSQIDARATTCPQCQNRTDTNTGKYHAGSLIGALGLLVLVAGFATGSGGALGLGALVLIVGLGIRGSG